MATLERTERKSKGTGEESRQPGLIVSSDGRIGSVSIHLSKGLPMRCGMVIALALLPCVGFSAEKLPEGAAVYDIFPASERPHLVKAYTSLLKTENSEIERAKKNVVRAKDADKEAAKEAVEKTKAYFEHLKSTNDPPYVGASLNNWGEDKRRDGKDREWKTGAIGGYPFQVHVVNVIDGKSALVKRGYYLGTEYVTQILMVKNLDTSKWSNKSDVRLPGTLWVSGNATYETVTGSTNTVLVVEPFDWERYKKEFGNAKSPKAK